VACADITGAIQIAVATTGQDMQESGFLVTVDDEPITLDGANRATIRRPAGQHSVQLDTGSLNSNCTVSGGNPRSETVTVGATTEVTIGVTCAALARVVVSVTTTGQDIDTDGYSLYLSYDDYYYNGRAYSLAIPANGTVTGPGMLPATYTVSLYGIASNCRQSSVFPSPVTVAGADVPLSITVVCNPARQLAFVTGVGAASEIAVGSEASASYTRLTTNTVADSNPAWSPDGSRLAFTSARDGTGNPEIYTMNADGSDARRLTTSAGADYQPAWSSDGSRIAFVSERDGNAEIYVMGADGSTPVRLTIGTGIDAEPAWSPAGNRILFVSNRNTGTPAVYVMNADGSGVTRLTTSTMAEASPTWSPSGLLIALMRERQLQVMNANGSRQLLRNAYAEFSTSVSWGSDDRITYTGYRCISYYDCAFGINVLRLDESIAELPWALASEPAWRP
jgi:Tol biopolymer transport system component